MSSHHDNQGLLTTCFPGYTSSALTPAPQGLLNPEVSGQGFRVTFSKKRVGRASDKLNPDKLKWRVVTWSVVQARDKVLLDLP